MERDCEPFETAHRLIATLAYPEPESASKRAGLETNLNRRLVAELRTQGSEFARETLSRLAGKSFKTSFRGHAGSKNILNRMNQRMKVARMFRREGRKALDGQFPDLPPGIKRYSLNELSRYVTSDDDDESHNFQKRWFQVTLPVLHIAMGFDLASCFRFGDIQAITFSVHDEDFLEEILFWTGWVKKVVADNGLYKVPRPEVPVASPD
jgi:hypothetical protein